MQVARVAPVCRLQCDIQLAHPQRSPVVSGTFRTWKCEFIVGIDCSFSCSYPPTIAIVTMGSVQVKRNPQRPFRCPRTQWAARAGMSTEVPKRLWSNHFLRTEETTSRPSWVGVAEVLAEGEEMAGSASHCSPSRP